MEHFDMKGSKVNDYKRSLELGNSLAAANLANAYIQAGFWEDAERILEALNNKEKEVQEKLKKKKGKAVEVEIEKDW